MAIQTKNIAHILLVEDNEGDILLTLDAFKESELETKISVARNGEEALDFLFKRGEFANAKRPDIILLDINLPIFNGHYVLQQIKNDINLKSIPCIILSTSSSRIDVDAAYNNHCNSYIKKPIDMTNFLSAILKIQEFWLQLTTLST